MQEQGAVGGKGWIWFEISLKLMERFLLASAGFGWRSESKGANGVSRGMQNPQNNKGQAGILSKAISADKESSEYTEQEMEIQE